MTNFPKGMRIGVARAADIGDCTNGGISSRFDRLTLVGYQDTTGMVHALPREAQVFEVADDAPPVIMRLRHIGGPVLDIVPADDDRLDVAPGWFMAGGNYACWSDSRISELTQTLSGRRFYGALSIHDRQEN